MSTDQKSMQKSTAAAVGKVIVNFNDYDYAKRRIDKIIDSWAEIEVETARVRELRHIRVNEELMRRQKLFEDDEIYVAVRLIDTNIRREQPQFFSYFMTSRRAAIFEPKLNSTPTPDEIVNLETAFTSVARYEGHEKTFIKVVDGAQTHGWDFVEVVFDETKPGHFALEHVGHDRLMFDLDTEELQNQELIVRIVTMTAVQLQQNVADYDFDQEAIDDLLSRTPSGENKKQNDNEDQTRDIPYIIHKCFYRSREDNVIYVGWYGRELNKWIKKPEKLFLGRRDFTQDPIVEQEADELQGLEQIADYPLMDEVAYPFYGLYYFISENPKVIDSRGRAYLDEPAQEAASALLSSIVNGTVRASDVYVSENPAGQIPGQNNAPLKTTAMALKRNTLYNRPLTFFNMPYPDEAVIKALQSVTTENQAETAKVDVAAQNRKDSRKTATEIAAAVDEASKLSAVQVSLLSIFIREVYTRCFDIFRNRVLQGGKIEVSEQLLLALRHEYTIKASGDVDVIQRQERIMRQQQAWPVLQQTPIASLFLQDMIRSMFPEEASKYIAALGEADAAKALVQKLAMVLQSVMTNEQGQLEEFAIPYQGQLVQLAGEVQQFLSGGLGQPQPQPQSLQSSQPQSQEQ